MGLKDGGRARSRDGQSFKARRRAAPPRRKDPCTRMKGGRWVVCVDGWWAGGGLVVDGCGGVCPRRCSSAAISSAAVSCDAVPSAPMHLQVAKGLSSAR